MLGLQVDNAMEVGKRWDLFIAYVVEDEEEIARPLNIALNAKRLKVWSGNYALRVGDNLHESIDYGLVLAKAGIVILSNHFFGKHWPHEELDYLATCEVSGKKVIFPIWHKVGFQEVFEYSAALADRVATSTDKGLEYVVRRILEVAK
jgi:hypothetical protein